MWFRFFRSFRLMFGGFRSIMYSIPAAKAIPLRHDAKICASGGAVFFWGGVDGLRRRRGHLIQSQFSTVIDRSKCFCFGCGIKLKKSSPVSFST